MKRTGTVQLDRIEAHLRPAELEAISEWCQEALIRVEVWPEQPELRGFVDLALRRLMGLMRRTGRARSDTKALELAAGRFGLNPDSTRKRWERRRKATLATECPHMDSGEG